MIKPVIKKRDGKWVYAGYYDNRASKFVTRLNRKDTGYKDCRGCTIREGDRLRGIHTGDEITNSFELLEFLSLEYFEIIRNNNNNLGCNYEL